MAVYKVPQDVEAEDKLLGPLTFKQFIFLLIAGGAAMFAWLLFTIQPVLAIIPLPIILIFGGLAVFRREDQPVERYLLSFFNYTLRPRVRLWSTEGYYDHLVITAPKTMATPALKQDVSQVHGQLEKLAQIVDTRGWSVKQPNITLPNQVGQGDDRLFLPQVEAPPEEVQESDDIMDDANPEVVQLDSILQQEAERQRQALLERVKQQASEPSHSTATTEPQAGSAEQERVAPAVEPAPSSGNTSDIMNLSDQLTVSQIQDQVNRQATDQKLEEGEEIKLR
ncbi:MAG: PrgI family protein [Candidatus Saccharimonadales bacterium]